MNNTEKGLLLKGINQILNEDLRFQFVPCGNKIKIRRSNPVRMS